MTFVVFVFHFLLVMTVLGFGQMSLHFHILSHGLHFTYSEDYELFHMLGQRRDEREEEKCMREKRIFSSNCYACYPFLAANEYPLR